MVAVKVCGVRTIAAAVACEAAKVDFVGFNFVPDSRRFVSPLQATHIKHVLSSTNVVGVFQNMDDREIHRIVDQVGLSWVQLHGEESPEFCAQLREQGIRVIKAFSVSEQIMTQMTVYHGSVDVLLLDGPSPGRGVGWSWETLACTQAWIEQRRDEHAPRVFVAGGITPRTVGSAIGTLLPDGIDVASGVESHGDIDPLKVEALCAAVRSTTVEMV